MSRHRGASPRFRLTDHDPIASFLSTPPLWAAADFPGACRPCRPSTGGGPALHRERRPPWGAPAAPASRSEKPSAAPARRIGALSSPRPATWGGSPRPRPNSAVTPLWNLLPSPRTGFLLACPVTSSALAGRGRPARSAVRGAGRPLSTYRGRGAARKPAQRHQPRASRVDAASRRVGPCPALPRPCACRQFGYAPPAPPAIPTQSPPGCSPPRKPGRRRRPPPALRSPRQS